jgi:serine/threonine protein kinase
MTAPDPHNPRPSSAPDDPEATGGLDPPAGAASALVLAGYEALEKLAEGGMGVVYRAFDPLLKRLVALKMIRADLVLPDRLGRFRKEAEALARLQHPHIVGVYGWQEAAGRPVLVLEYVAGGSLEQRLTRQRLSLAESVRLVAVLARAVQAAHQAGVVHRDLKPANVLMAPPVEGNSGTVAGGFPKVSDFGLAYLASSDALALHQATPENAPSLPASDDTRVTATGEVVGTPAYMAPEQAGGQLKQVGPAADVWALGVILYRCLSGRMPFPGGNVLETIDWIKTRPPEPLWEHAPAVPEVLVSLCLRCLDKDPARRPSAAELALRLEQLAASERLSPGEQQLLPPADEPRLPILPDWRDLSLQGEEIAPRPAEPVVPADLCELPAKLHAVQPEEEPAPEVQEEELEEWAAALLLSSPARAAADRPPENEVVRKRLRKRKKNRAAGWSRPLSGPGKLVVAAGVLLGLGAFVLLAVALIARLMHGR